MSDDKTNESALYADHRRFLKEMVEKYDLEDEAKALRILVTYTIQEGNLDDIFKGIRCRHCG